MTTDATRAPAPAAGPPPTDSPESIERDLARTRARIDATIDALQQKLSPGEMVDQAVTYLKETGGGEFGRNLMVAVRDNPVPVALVGIGLAWLMVSSTLRGGAGQGGGGGGSGGTTGDDRGLDYDRSAASVAALGRYEEGRERHRDVPGPGPASLHGGFAGATDADAPHAPAMGAAGEGRADRRIGGEPGLGPDRAGGEEGWEDEYLTQRGAYASAAVEDLATKANEAGAAVPRDPGEAEGAYQARVYAAKGAVLGLRRDEDEEHVGFSGRVEAAVAAAAERYRRHSDRARGVAGRIEGDTMAERGQSTMRNLSEQGRSAAGAAYDYGRSAAETAYDYGRSAADTAYGYGRSAAGTAYGYGADLGGGVWRSVRENPLPWAVIAAGATWLLVSGWDREAERRREAAYRYYAGGGYDRGGYGPAAYEGGRAQRGRVAGAGAGSTAGAGEDLAARAHAAGAAVRRAADESEEAFSERVYGARAAALGLARGASETLQAFRERVDGALAAAGEQYRRLRDQAASYAGEAVGYGQDAARGLYDYGRSAVDSAYGYGRSAYGGARDAGGRGLSWLQGQPLLLGALGVSAGALLALLIPPSRYERQAVAGIGGDVRERLGDVASGAVESAGRVAREVAGAAREAVEREGFADLSPAGLAEAARGKVREAAERARHVVEETAAAGREAVERELGNGGDKDNKAAAGSPAGSASGAAGGTATTGGTGTAAARSSSASGTGASGTGSGGGTTATPSSSSSSVAASTLRAGAATPTGVGAGGSVTGDGTGGSTAGTGASSSSSSSPSTSAAGGRDDRRTPA